MAHMTLPQPGDLTSLVLRTDFGNESAWEAVQAAIHESEAADATFVSDSAFADVSVQAVVDADDAAEDSDKICYLFLADATTMTSEEHPLLAVDLYDEPGRTFRLPPRWYADVSNSRLRQEHVRVDGPVGNVERVEPVRPVPYYGGATEPIVQLPTDPLPRAQAHRRRSPRARRQTEQRLHACQHPEPIALVSQTESDLAQVPLALVRLETVTLGQLDYLGEGRRHR